MRILVTGAAGFIGAATAQALLDEGHDVVGIDDVNDYYETALKDARLAKLGRSPRFRFERANLAERAAMERIFRTGAFARVAHLGAQAGVRHSIDQPLSYVESVVQYHETMRLLPPLLFLESPCLHNVLYKH